MELQELERQLQLFALGHYGEGALVSGVEAMPGHAGLSFGFRVDYRQEGVSRRDPLVMRVPPRGVRQSGNTDVLRQVPLLQTLRRNGVPVPRVRWYGGDLRWFGVPYIMVERLPGRTFSAWNPDPSFDLDPENVAHLYRQAVRVLIGVHHLDWQRELAAWEAPRSLEQEIGHWDPILAKAAERQWVSQGHALRDLLLDRRPEAPRIGLFHGDFQGTNLLFDGDRLVAVLDWEIAGLGAQLLDLGWLLVFTDPESWESSHRRLISSVPAAEELVALYEEGTRSRVPGVGWYRALAGYRFGVIAGFNVMLHRRGKRHDPEWERFAPSVPVLFARAGEMLRRA